MIKFKFSPSEAMAISDKIDAEGGLIDAVLGYGLRFGNGHIDGICERLEIAVNELAEALESAGVELDDF